jgi:uncharacterized protein YbbC (DUF1343 family)
MSHDMNRSQQFDFELGIEVFLKKIKHDAVYFQKFKNQRWGLLAHPASVLMHHEKDQYSVLMHSLDALLHAGVHLTCAFGPQHGMRGEKQYNMMESDDYIDPVHKIPVYSLYGKTRVPTKEMLSNCDGVLVDLQDLGCRIYTYLTTLKYMMDECARYQKKLVVLDRPNPAGRAIEGSILKPGNESFVGVGPVIMRHGMTLGEIAIYMKRVWKINVDLEVIAMKNYHPDQPSGMGWPIEGLSWVNPSPNAPTLSMARCYSGTVLLEGTNLSEGRGTTRPLEGFGAPDLNGDQVLAEMIKLAKGSAKNWLQGCALRSYYFEPTFYKHQGKLCSGVQFHVDHASYDAKKFKPYRLMALALKSIRILHPGYDLWRDFPYEYVTDRLAIDVITGGPEFRLWVDDPRSTVEDLESVLSADEKKWKSETELDYLYDESN